MTGTGGSLWVSTFAIHNSNADASGPLVRLDGQLRVTTPEFVRASPVLAKTEEIWADGETVLAATAAAGHALVCFAAGSATGPVATLPVSGQVVALAATQDTVYVTHAAIADQRRMGRHQLSRAGELPLARDRCGWPGARGGSSRRPGTARSPWPA